MFCAQAPDKKLVLSKLKAPAEEDEVSSGEDDDDEDKAEEITSGAKDCTVPHWCLHS